MQCVFAFLSAASWGQMYHKLHLCIEAECFLRVIKATLSFFPPLRRYPRVLSGWLAKWVESPSFSHFVCEIFLNRARKKIPVQCYFLTELQTGIISDICQGNSCWMAGISRQVSLVVTDHYWGTELCTSDNSPGWERFTWQRNTWTLGCAVLAVPLVHPSVIWPQVRRVERKRLQLLFTFFEEGISKLWELFQNSLLSQQGVEFNSKPNQEELHDIGLDPSWVCALQDVVPAVI